MKNKKNTTLRAKPMQLPQEQLADALVEMPQESINTGTLILRIGSTSADNVKRIKSKMSGLKRTKRFITIRESAALAHSLTELLKDIKSEVHDPLTGVKLIASFYETDSGTLGHCDDSNGYVGDIYRCDAKTLFMEYAKRCNSKDEIVGILLKLLREDDYGIRDSLIDCAGEYLPVPIMRELIGRFRKLVDEADSETEKQHNLFQIASLAHQIKDAKLFEQTCLEQTRKSSTSSFIEIAGVYLECGDVQTAQEWLGKVPTGETFMAQERDNLQVEIYRKLGSINKLTDLMYLVFRVHRTSEKLQELLEVVGRDKRDSIITVETEKIHGEPALKLIDAEFLVAIGKIDDAEQYLLARSDQFDGDYYDPLLDIAEIMEKENRFLITSLLYRCLLMSILNRGYRKAYRYAVRYLKKLDKLAPAIADWKIYDDHTTFMLHLRKTQGKKTSFWPMYEG